MRPIPFWLLLLFAAVFLTFTACRKKDTASPATPPDVITPVDTVVFNPIIASIARNNGTIHDTFIYDDSNRLIEHYYIDYNQKPPRVSQELGFEYDAFGKLSRINSPGYSYYQTATYYNEDSLVMTHSISNSRTRYRLDTSGLPLREYNHYYYSDTFQRINFSWEINSLTGNVEVQHTYYYPTPNYDPLPYYNAIEDDIFEYTNIENPLHAIAKYNPVFTTLAFINLWSPIPSMSRNMMSAHYWKNYYGKKELRESYKYTLDSMGKYPIQVVEYFTDPSNNNKDSSVSMFIYRNAK